jgi:mRNA-degrading endonuclease RelE of RelBE toxin-antitoxin system
LSWKVFLDPAVDRFLQKQNKSIETMLRLKLRKLEEPLPHIGSFQGDHYKFRLGDYRALVTLDFRTKSVFVHVLDKRGRVYR